MNKVGNYYAIDLEVDLVPSKNTKIARYYVECFDRELVLILSNINLTDKDVGEIEMQLDKAYTDWHISEDQSVYQICCEEYMINNLDRYYRNCIVATLYVGDDEKYEQ
jgi:hypothetical protein